MMTYLCMKLEVLIDIYIYIYLFIFISIHIDKYDNAMFVYEVRSIDIYIYIYICVSIRIDKHDDIMFVYEVRTPLPTNMLVVLTKKPPSSHFFTYSRITLIQINWDSEISGYAENPDNWIFL